jgi:hypothetical protein
VGSAVAEDFAAFGVGEGDEADRGVGVKRGVEVNEGAVDGGGERLCGKTRTDGFRDLARSDAVGEFFCGAIGKCNSDWHL